MAVKASTTLLSNPRAIYWIGADGNAYVKGPGGNNATTYNIGPANGKNQDYVAAVGNGIQARKVNNPNAPVTNNNGANNSLSGNNTGGNNSSNSTSTSTVNPQTAAYQNDVIGQLQGQIGQNQLQRDQGLKSLLDSYNLSTTRLNQSRGQQLRNFGINQQQLQQNKRTSLNGINQGAANTNNSLQQLLASHGAGVSSAAQYNVPDAISTYYGGQRNDALQNYGQQQQQLDINKADSNTAYNNSVADLIGQYRSKQQQVRQGALSTKNGLLGKLADAATSLGIAKGGTYQSTAGSRQPFINQIKNNQKVINNLFNQYRNPATVQPVNASTPDISTYTADPLQQNLNKNGQQVNNTSTYLPFLQGSYA